MLGNAINVLLDESKRVWHSMTSTTGQITTSAATFGVSYANQGPSPLLAEIGMIAGICATVTLIAVNLLRIIKDLYDEDNPLSKLFKKTKKKKSRKPVKK